MAAKRSHVIALMRGAFRRGQSASSFYRDMREKGISYRRTDMLSDWRSVNEVEKKEGLMRFIRKDYYPTKTVIAGVEWALSKEFMYKVKVQSRLKPDEPMIDRFVNIMQDSPLTPLEVEEMAWAMIKEQSPKVVSQVVEIMPWTAVRRV